MTASNASEIFGGSAPIGSIAQGQLAANGNYLPCDGSEYLRASYPNLDYTGLDTYGTNTPVARTLPRSGNTKVAYGAGVHLAITAGTNGYSTSADGGVTWVSRTLPGTPGALVDVIFAKDLFVVMGFGSGACLTSPDGINWTSRTIPTDLGAWVRVAFAGVLFFAFQAISAGTSKFATSPDGVTWTLRTAAFSTPYGVAFGGGTYALIHATTGASGVLSVSFDAVAWVQKGIQNSAGSAITSSAWDGVAYLNSKWLISTSAGTIYVSTDNLTSFATSALLAAITSPAAIRILSGVLYTLPPSGSSQIFSTTDLQNFKVYTLPDAVGADSAVYGGGVLLVGCLTGAAVKTLSADMTKFRTPAIPKNNDGDRYFIKAK